MPRSRAVVPGVIENPPERPPKYEWDALADWLRKHPLKWRKVFDKDRVSLVNALRQGSITVLRPSLGFEMTTANNTKVAPRTCTLFMRYNPDRDEES